MYLNGKLKSNEQIILNYDKKIMHLDNNEIRKYVKYV